MDNTQWVALLVEVGVIALAALLTMLRGFR